MQLKYFSLTLCILAFSIGAFAQNRPLLSETSPAGSVSSMNLPPEVTTGYRLNSIITYTPIVPISVAGNINTSSAPSQVKQQQVYMDGNNRPFQSITRNVATVDGQAKHVVQIYDNGTQRERYSFLPYASNDGSLQANAFQKQRDYYANLYPEEGYTAFSKTANNSVPDSRSMVSYAPGKSQVGQSRGTDSRVTTNGPNEVRLWSLDGSGLPVSSGYYPANELFGKETILPANATQAFRPKTIAYNDRDGKMILKMVMDSTYATMVNGLTTYFSTYQYTYYVYDDKGNLVYTISPKAYQYFADHLNLPQDIVDNLCFSNIYDSKGRLAGTRKPGEEGFTWAVYDRKNRLVMRQTPMEATANEWEVSFYDAKDRVKATSIYMDDNHAPRDSWQAIVDAVTTATSSGDLLYYLCTDEGQAAYPNNGNPYSLTGIIQNNTMMSYNWYDRYDQVDFAPYWDMCTDQLQFSGDLLNTPGAETPKKSSRIYGMATASMVRVLRSPGALAENLGEWRVSLNYYDDQGRSINSVNFAADGDMDGERFNFDFAGTQYDFAGRVLLSKHITYKHNIASGQTGFSHKELTKFLYDDNSGSLIKTLHKIDGGAWATINLLSYDDLGRIKRKDIGGGGEIQDFSYNIRGQLTGINGNYAETGDKGGFSRTFGESLKYDYGFVTPRYDGKIAGMIWRGASGLDMYAYGYTYAGNQFLKKADFSYSSDGTSWDNADLDYSVSNLFYDKNGNIKSMKQRGQKIGVGPVDMDDLVYEYEPGSNRLSQVTDNGETYYGAGDFNDNNSVSDYSYDVNGNLYKDKNKGINEFIYTRFNKPVTITKDDGSSIEYSYDASGNKLEEIINDNAGAHKRTEYIGSCVYQIEDLANNNEDNLKYILNQEGRSVFDPKSVSVLKEEFFVKDHLGNVRSTINVISSTPRHYLATYEIASANLENLVWDGLDEVRDTKPGGGGDNTMAANLNGADPSRRVGSSILVHVMAGDKVSMSVNTLYNSGYLSDEDNPIPAEQALDAIVSTLTGGIGGSPGEGHDTKLVSDVFTDNNFSVFNDIVNSNTDPTKPRAYLNYVLFDENMKIVENMSGAFQANGENTWTTIGTANALEVPRNGYLALYLSNNSQVSATCIPCSDVYFDNFNFTVIKGQLLEETHYYPFGLPLQGLSSVTADGFTENRHKYQGNELTKDLDLNLMDFHARQYDPQLGRFLSIDPMASRGDQDMYSPYAAMGNVPESNVDPNGMMQVNRVPSGSTYMSVRAADGGTPGGFGPASGQGRDAWGEGGFSDMITGLNPGFSSGGMSEATNEAVDDENTKASSNMSTGTDDNSSTATNDETSDPDAGSADPKDDEKPKDKLLETEELKDWDKIVIQEQLGLNTCGFTVLSMIFQYYGGAQYDARDLADMHTQGGGDIGASNIPGFMNEKDVYFDKSSKSKYTVRATGTGTSRNALYAMRKGVASMFVAAPGTTGFDSRAHAVIPVKIEVWQKPNNDLYFKTWIINPAAPAGVQEMGQNFWDKTLNTITIEPPQ